MNPLNIAVVQADDRYLQRLMKGYGEAIKELAAANIFPGDLLMKNFGVTGQGQGRIVFYDYDEITYMTDCNFRRVPDSGDYFDELFPEPWFSIRDTDVFPETFGAFFFPKLRLREIFLRKHSDLVSPEFWRETQTLIRNGSQPDVFPYAQKHRFRNRFGGLSKPKHKNVASGLQ